MSWLMTVICRKSAPMSAPARPRPPVCGLAGGLYDSSNKRPDMIRTTRNLPKHHVSKTIRSPVGELKLVASAAGLAAILWENDDPARVRRNIVAEDERNPILVETGRQLAAYFAGRRTTFDLPLDFAGTEFQQRVWRSLLTIPFGETRTYAQIARQIGRPKAVRAVGAANGKNPISIVAPCHRVIGSNGALTGFAGGIAAKAWLLRLEGARAEPAAPAKPVERAA